MKWNNIVQGIMRLEDVSSIPLDIKNKDYEKYLEWVAEGNTAEVVDMDKKPDPTTEQIAKEARKAAAKLLKDKVKNKTALSKDELATIIEALMDLIS